MVLAESVLLGVVLSLPFGGRPGRLGNLRLRGVWLVYAAVLLQIVAFPSGLLPWSTPESAARGLWLVSYGLLVGFAGANLRIRGVPVVVAGLLCNLVAVVANGGLMPADPKAVQAAGLAYRLRNNSITTAHAHVGWLIDRWAVPSWIPLGNVFSIGDVLIALGTVAAVFLALRPPRRPSAVATSGV